MDRAAFFLKGVAREWSYEKDHELVSSEAANDVSGAEELGKPVSDEAQKLVASIVPQIIIDYFKIINVKDQKCTGAGAIGNISLQVGLCRILKSLFVQDVGECIAPAQLLVFQSQVKIPRAKVQDRVCNDKGKGNAYDRGENIILCDK